MQEKPFFIILTKRMMNVIRKMLALLLAFGMLGCAVCHSEEWDTFARQKFGARKITGGAVVIALDGEVLYSYTHGFRDARQTQKTTLDTCFRAASVTKLVSAIGLMRLMEEKGLSLDTPVTEIVGFPVRNPSYPDRPVTVRQVLSHTSSILSTNYYFPSWEKLGVGTIYFAEPYGPGDKYVYSNLNGGLIGAMIEALSGQSVNSYMQQHVFRPLSVNAAYQAALLPDTADIADRMDKDGTLFQTVKRAMKDIENYEDTCDPRWHTDRTVGSLYISVNGMIRLISMLENGGELDGVRILQPETVQLMMQDQDEIPGSTVYCKGRYGLCLDRVKNMPGGTWYGHQGRLRGLSANMYFQPDTGLSIAVIADGYTAYTQDEVVTIARVFMEKAQELLPQE